LGILDNTKKKKKSGNTNKMGGKNSKQLLTAALKSNNVDVINKMISVN
jgi:hypothetical protein